MADLYDAIKTQFDAEATLVTAVFDELHAGEVGSPTDVAIPYCSMSVPREVVADECFGGNEIIEEEFAFQVVDATREETRDHAELINAAFNKRSLTLSAAGVGTVTLHKRGQSEDQVAEDRWLCEIDYMARYTRRRPA